MANERLLLWINLFVLIINILLLPIQGQSSTAFPLSSVRVRLAGGINEREGRVEVFYQGSWGTICSDGWDVKDAAVVCRMLGYTGIARAVTGGIYPPGTGSIFLRGVDCAGNEVNIAYCQYQGWLITVCNHTEDAGVICLGDLAPTTTPTTIRTTFTTLPPKICDNPSPNIRLVDGANVVNTAVGRVQYFYNNTWRSICNDRWGVADAAVACRMLCYNPANARAIIGSSEFGNATEGFWLGNVVCNGSETDLASCPHSPWGQTACNATETAGVSCVLDSPTPPPLPEPVIECTNEMITAKFSRSADPFLRSEHLSVSGPNGEALTTCGYQTSADANYVTIAIPFMRCNTNRTLNNTNVIYNNIVRYAVPSPSDVITRTTIYYIPISCVINRTASPDNGFDPQTRTPPPQSGGGKYSVQLLLFEDNRFSNPVADNPLRVVLGDWLYVGVQLYSSDPNLKIILLDCYATPSTAPESQPQYYLIRNKCAVESTVTMYPMNDTLFAFRFQSFKFLGNVSNTVMYLHANTYVCSVTETAGNCNRNCLNSTSLRKRRGSEVHEGPLLISSQWQIMVEPEPMITTHITAMTLTTPSNMAVISSKSFKNSLSVTINKSTTTMPQKTEHAKAGSTDPDLRPPTIIISQTEALTKDDLWNTNSCSLNIISPKMMTVILMLGVTLAKYN